MRKLTACQIEELVAAHEAWLLGSKSRDCKPDLSGVDFGGVELFERKLHRANLQGSNLANAKFVSCDLSEANIAGCRCNGANFSGSDMKKVFGPNADFSNCNFCTYEYEEGGTRSVFLAKAKLVEARLDGANFSRALLSGVALSGSRISKCKFDGADLSEAKLQNCIAQLSRFNGARFRFADLAEADLRYSDLESCDLKYASLISTDLRQVKGLFFLDDNTIRETNFSPTASDAYSTMRRTYTGVMFFLIAFLTITAISPYAGKAIAWHNLSELQAAGIDILPQAGGSQNAAKAGSAINDQFKTTRVLWVVIGLEEANPWLHATLTLILVAYNVLRGYVTVKMGLLRDAEERSLHAPAKEDYWMLFRLHHYVLRWATYMILAISVFKVFGFLSGDLYIPI